MTKIKPHIKEETVLAELDAKQIFDAFTLLSKGAKLRAVSRELGLKYEHVRTVYHVLVKPKLEACNWELEAKQAKCPPMTAAKLRAAVKLDHRASSFKRGWAGLAAHVLNYPVSWIEGAVVVLEKGTPTCIEAAESGVLRMPDAARIASFPADEQVQEIENVSKEVRKYSDYVRSIVYSSWSQAHELERIHDYQEGWADDLTPEAREEMSITVDLLIRFFDDLAGKLGPIESI